MVTSGGGFEGGNGRQSDKENNGRLNEREHRAGIRRWGIVLILRDWEITGHYRANPKVPRLIRFGGIVLIMGNEGEAL